MRFSEVVTERSVTGVALGLLRRERILTLTALGGFLLAGIAAVIAMVHGDWLIGAEGRLKEVVRFDLALGIFVLTLAMLLPLAGMSPTGQRRWRRWVVGLTLYAYAMENIQTWRGLDPRFSSVAGPIDQILGGVFFVQALGTLVIFVILTSRFFRDDVLPDHVPLRSALRYAALAANLAFFVGILMSGLGGRVINDTGDLMMIHAAGFHGLQTVPLVALLLGWSTLPLNTTLRWVRLAGVGWLLFCFALLLQALTGAQLTTRDFAFGLGIAGLGSWVIALIYAWWARRSATAIAAA